MLSRTISSDSKTDQRAIAQDPVVRRMLRDPTQIAVADREKPALCGSVIRALANRSMADPRGTVAAPSTVGMRLMTGFRKVGRMAGKIYIRENGRTYDCIVRPISADRLEVLGQVTLLVAAPDVVAGPRLGAPFITSDGNIACPLRTVPGARIQLEQADTLGVWRPLPDPFVVPDGQAVLLFSAPSLGQSGFYRATRLE